jgi:hypothetical protein
MKNERLSSIGILHIHRSKRVNIEGIIDKFAGAANRRLTAEGSQRVQGRARLGF